MPGPATSDLPRPQSWDESEDMVWEIYAREWRDPHAQRNGRSGQPQQGVDIYGRPRGLEGRYAGIQCKRYDDGRLTESLVAGEAAKAERFRSALAEYLSAITASRDASLREDVREINTRGETAGKSSVQIVFREDLCGKLVHPNGDDLLRKFYVGWLRAFAATSTTTLLNAAHAQTAEIVDEAARDFGGQERPGQQHADVRPHPPREERRERGEYGDERPSGESRHLPTASPPTILANCGPARDTRRQLRIELRSADKPPRTVSRAQGEGRATTIFGRASPLLGVASAQDVIERALAVAPSRADHAGVTIEKWPAQGLGKQHHHTGRQRQTKVRHERC